MKTLFALLMLVTSAAFGAAVPNGIPTATGFAFSIDKYMGPTAYNQTLGTRVYRAHTTGFGIWDFAVQGGAPATYTVGVQLPPKAIIRKVFFDTVTGVTPTGTSLAWQYLNAGDLKTTTAAASWTGRQDGIPDGTAANMLKGSTTATDVKVVLSGSTATAGKVRIFVDYVVSE